MVKKGNDDNLLTQTVNYLSKNAQDAVKAVGEELSNSPLNPQNYTYEKSDEADAKSGKKLTVHKERLVYRRPSRTPAFYDPKGQMTVDHGVVFETITKGNRNIDKNGRVNSNSKTNIKLSPSETVADTRAHEERAIKDRHTHHNTPKPKL